MLFPMIELIVYDFDGVMTNNKVLVNEMGIESVFVNRSDGYAVSQIKKMGITQIILSTEKNNVVVKRGEKLDIEVLYGIDDKKRALIRYCKDNNIELEKVMFIGNDLNDYECMKIVGVKGCPADAENEIIEISDWISKRNGGDGVIRELYRELNCCRRENNGE